MLTHLQLRDLVIVDEAELDFGPGLTALTGETGAGKSIVVDALLLIAGGRGGADIVRQGAERAEVAASFAALPEAAVAWLEAQAIDHDGEVIVRRVIGVDGRSRAYVNGQLVPIQQLREFAEFLIEVHGQQEFQHLVRRSAQREMLDEHLDQPTLPGVVAEIHDRFRACRRDYDSLKSAAEDRESRLDLLRYQLTELKAEVTTVTAIEELFVEQKRISARGRLSAAAQTALTAVYEADAASAHDLLAKASAALRAVGDADPELAQPMQLLAEATILTDEAGGALRRYLDNLDVDPGRQEEIERQAAALEGLARKHRRTVLDLPAQLAGTELELQTLENADFKLAELERRLALLESEFRAAAQRLTQSRQQASAALGGEITDLMQTLGMAGGRFVVSVQPSETGIGPHGVDDIEFLVSANPGQPPKGLAKVASGGELSRISLAVQVAAAGKASSLCMVFDEVDSGIGGGTAEIVGRQLRELGRNDEGRGDPGSNGQVLCVTHLAQVAAQAHTQFRVIKQTDGKKTRTVVKTLSAAERTDEIARMLGGIDISDQARAHAREMLGHAPAARAPATAAPGKKRVKAARN
ncbi:MAG: repair protein RecN [Gammaproteobacteria bacterium]|jgi:DNA repair protein RecN (Recombination protein N)|nr:repair protein RecN [Gammaproteobacteria bacterium]